MPEMNEQSLDELLDEAWHAAGAFLQAAEQMGGPVSGVGYDPDAMARRTNEGFFAKLDGVACVYFIQAGRTGPLKIGFAADLRSRLSTLQACNHETLYVRGAMAGGRDLERQIQERFRRYWRRGEWYEPTRELVDFVNEQAQ